MASIPSLRNLPTSEAQQKLNIIEDKLKKEKTRLEEEKEKIKLKIDEINQEIEKTKKYKERITKCERAGFPSLSSLTFYNEKKEELSKDKYKINKLLYQILFLDGKRFRDYSSTETGYIYRCLKYLSSKKKYNNQLLFDSFGETFNGVINVDDFYEKNKDLVKYCLDVLQKYYECVQKLIEDAHMIHNYNLLYKYIHNTSRHLCFCCCQDRKFPDRSLQNNLEKGITSNTNLPLDITKIIVSYCVVPIEKFDKPFEKCIVSVESKYEINDEYGEIKWRKIYCHKGEHYYRIKSNNYYPFSMSLDSKNPRWSIYYH